MRTIILFLTPWRRLVPYAACLILGLVLAPPLAAQTGDQAALKELRLMANFALLDEDSNALLAICEQILSHDPDDSLAIDHKLKALTAQKREEEAIQFIRGLWARYAKRYAYLRFEAGYLRLRQKQHDKALVNFRAAEEVDSQRAIREQAYVYQSLRDHARALATIERLDQGSAETWLIRGQVHLAAQEFDLARQDISKALTLNPDSQQTQSLRSLQKAVDRDQRADRPLRGSVTVMAQYEDNVFQDPLQSNPYSSPSRKKGDASLLTKVDMDYRLGRADQASWGLTTRLQALQYMDLRDANYAAWSLGPYWQYQTPDWGIRLPYDYAYYWAKGALTRKLAMHSFYPSLRLQHTPHLRTDVHGLLQSKQYRQGEPNFLAWRLGVIHYLSPDPALRPHLRLGYAASQDIASDEKNGFMTGEVSLGGALPLGPALTLDVSLTYVRYWFDDHVDPYLVQRGEISRRDNQYRAAAQLLWRPCEDWLVVLGYFHTSNDSGLIDPTGFEPYDFRRNVVSLMVNWAF